MTVKLTGNFLATARCLIFNDGNNIAWTFNSLTNTLEADYSGAGSAGSANPSATIGLTAVNGNAAAWMTSDSAPALSQAIVPTWTGAHVWSSTMAASANPLTAATTRVQTGLAAFRSADSTSSSNTLTADAQLTLTFNETGKYAIEIFLPFYEATLGTGGFQFDLNSGTATVGGIVFGLDGFVTGAIANAAVTSVSTATSASSVATSASAPSWYLAKGWISITVAGTVAIRWAQASSLGADPTTLKAGAYFTAMKIG